MSSIQSASAQVQVQQQQPQPQKFVILQPPKSSTSSVSSATPIQVQKLAPNIVVMNPPGSPAVTKFVGSDGQTYTTTTYEQQSPEIDDLSHLE